MTKICYDLPFKYHSIKKRKEKNAIESHTIEKRVNFNFKAFFNTDFYQWCILNLIWVSLKNDEVLLRNKLVLLKTRVKLTQSESWVVETLTHTNVANNNFKKKYSWCKFSWCEYKLWYLPKKPTPLFGSPTPVLGMKVEQGESVIWLLKKNLSTTILMRRSCRELSIYMVIQMGIFKNNPITLCPYFTFIPKTGSSFHWVPQP